MDYHHQAGRSPTEQAPPPPPLPPARSGSEPGAEDDGTPPPDDLPACLSCRRRKSRCSRERPSCSQCLRLGAECMYVSKQKPGLKAGVVDALSRRIDVLEKLLLDSAGNKKPQLAFLDLDVDQLASLTALVAHGAAAERASSASSSGRHAASPLSESPRRQHRQQHGASASHTVSNSADRPRKRRRLVADEDGGHGLRIRSFWGGLDDHADADHDRDRDAEADASHDNDDDHGDDDGDNSDNNNNDDDDDNNDDDDDDDDDEAPWIPPLPPLPLLEAMVDAHFRTVHHWVPILHPSRFRAQLRDAAQRTRLAVLLHALAAMALKYVDADALRAAGLTAARVARQIRLSRRAVVLNAMDEPSLAHTQALIFLAFDYMGSGLVTKAWPIVASLTRMAVFLQLTVEPDDQAEQQSLLPSPALFAPAADPTEREERRRVFWAIFFLDRSTAITAGWHASLTSAEVHRRLPCSGGFWKREEPVTTPYFALWDNASPAAKMGSGGGSAVAVSSSSSSSLPSSSSSLSSSAVPVAATNTSPRGAADYHHHLLHSTSPGAANNNDPGVHKLGAVAYCVEATEHLSYVTSFFLKQPVDLEDKAAFQGWLMRFKELDLRLVHWKMNLPQEWSDLHAALKVDPNLSLSHLSHNASMILLHQHVAFPPADWAGLVKLPSSCSAETCQQSAVDMAALAHKYLRYVGGIANAQFAFCLFVAARYLVVSWRLDGSDAGARAATPGGGGGGSGGGLAPEFWTILECLDKISARWRGGHGPDGGDPVPARAATARPPVLDMAAQLAARLRELHARCAHDTTCARADIVALLSESSLDGLVNKKTRRPASLSCSASSLQQQQQQQQQLPHPQPSPGSALSTPSYAEASHAWKLNDFAAQRSPSIQNMLQGGGYVHPLSPGTQMAMAYGSHQGVQAPPTGGNRGGGSSPDNLLGLGMLHHPSHSMAHTQQQQQQQQPPQPQPGLADDDDDLAAMSQILLGHQFLDMDNMDRVMMGRDTSFLLRVE